jgi:hypothetical protein
MELNPFEEELKDTLRVLDAIDNSLSHEPGAVWPESVSKERNGLVWHVFDLARELDYPWGVGHDPTATYFEVILYIHVPINGEMKQLSWHVPRTVAWDGSFREEKSRRITEYTKETP